MRFKTERELINDFGERWRAGKVKYGWATQMDDFFGKEIEEKDAESIRKNNFANISYGRTTYNISQDMVVDEDMIVDDMYEDSYQFLTINQSL
jgi:hypothetical protein